MKVSLIIKSYPDSRFKETVKTMTQTRVDVALNAIQFL